MSITTPTPAKIKKVLKASEPIYSELDVKLMLSNYGLHIIQQYKSGKIGEILNATEFYSKKCKKK